MEAQRLSGRVVDSRKKGRGFQPHRHHCLVSLSKNINPSLVLVQPRKTRPFITEKLLMGRKESNQTKQILMYATNFCLFIRSISCSVLNYNCTNRYLLHWHKYSFCIRLSLILCILIGSSFSFDTINLG